MPNSARPSLAMAHSGVHKVCRAFLKTCLLGFVFLPLHVLSQTGLATLSGTVTDPTGALLPKAIVTVTNEDTGVTVKGETTRAGVYDIEALNPGKYRVVVEHQGFKQVEVIDLVLHTQDDISRNFVLPVGASSETIQVSGNQNSTNDSPAVSLTVTREFVENTPLNGRSFQDLIALAPGAVSNDNGLYSIDGQRTDANNFSVDGVAANLGTTAFSNQDYNGALPAVSATGTTQSLISVDAMEEFRIQTSGYTAEFGRQPGGQVEITTRSGTNQYHGTASEYFRNTVFDANNWFADETNQPKQAEHQNDFGGTLGGPLTIPRVYSGKDHTNFFFSYEGLRLLLPNFVSDVSVPTTAFRQSAAPGVQPFLNAAPLPNGATNPDGISALFSGGYSAPSNVDSTSIRIDHMFAPMFHAFFRLFDTPSSGITSEFPNVQGTSNNTLGVTIGSTLSISRNLTNETRLNYSKGGGTQFFNPSAFGGATPLPASALIPPQDQTLAGGYLTSYAIGVPGTSLGVGGQLQNFAIPQHQFNLVDSITWVKGRNTFKFGGDYRHLSPVIGTGQYETFMGLGSLADIQQGNADYLYLGDVLTLHPIFNNLSLFSQDSWKVRPYLSMDFGIRWELDPPPSYDDGNYPPALTSSNLATTQIAPYGTAMYHTLYDNFAPRLGFAWRLSNVSNHSISLRGGAGIFYDTGQNAGGVGIAGFSAPSYYNVPLPIPAADFVTPPPTTTLTPPYRRLIGLSDPNLKLPYAGQWNLSLDIGLASRNTLSISYVGNQGKRLIFQRVYLDGFPGNSEFTSNDWVATNDGASNYNALQVQDTGYVTRGLQLIASYSWAHALDNVSGNFSDEVGNAQPIKGNSDYDLHQVLNAAINYEVPGTSADGIAKWLTNGWIVSNRFAAQTGSGLNIGQGDYLTPNGQLQAITPNFVPGVPVYLHGVPNVPGGWELNAAAFAPVPVDSNGTPTMLGTVGRNVLFGPPFWSLNTALQRNFSLTEHSRLVFKAEAYNVFNHPDFSSVDTGLTDSTFGQATGQAEIGVGNSLYATGSPRSLQLMLKLQF
jgi:hypothetical protein